MVLAMKPDWHIEVCDSGFEVANEVSAYRVNTSASLTSSLMRFLSKKKIDDRNDESLTKIIGALKNLGCLYEFDDDACSVPDRLVKQIDYFACFSDIPMNMQHSLASSRILILGMGGTGSVFLQNMVAAGISNFIIVDQDSVEESNLNRQFIYTLADIGRPKVKVAQEYILARNPAALVDYYQMKLQTIADVHRVVGSAQVDLALIAVDTPIETIANTVSTALTELNIPTIYAGVGIRRIWVSDPSLEPFAPSQRARTTTASLATSNCTAATLAAHRSIEFLTKTAMPFTIEGRPA